MVTDGAGTITESYVGRPLGTRRVNNGPPLVSGIDNPSGALLFTDGLGNNAKEKTTTLHTRKRSLPSSLGHRTRARPSPPNCELVIAALAPTPEFRRTLCREIGLHRPLWDRSRALESRRSP
jgi:hypothetical protein